MPLLGVVASSKTTNPIQDYTLSETKMVMIDTLILLTKMAQKPYPLGLHIPVPI